ncbi:TVP38/TMEM64 family protein [Scenedesmus sp. PABB004]|nr:TVP38/TMEM64 family protein [Scenedesmus sp. PABB004]
MAQSAVAQGRGRAASPASARPRQPWALTLRPAMARPAAQLALEARGSGAAPAGRPPAPLAARAGRAAAAAAQAWLSLHALPAHAAEGVPPAALLLFREFLDQITALGPWGGALFVVTVMVAEMVPLFPTQPLTLASGLLFGPTKGAALVVLGVTLAAVNAFTLARGVGRGLAERIIAHEVGPPGEPDAAGGGAPGVGPVAAQLAAVSRAIEEGGFVRQVTAITLLRLTPVVPFSASNYLLGLTPVSLAPLVVGTVAGMSVWSLLYASLGSASRSLLDSGVALDVLMEDLAAKAGQYSEDVAVAGLGLGVVAGVTYVLTQRLGAPAVDGLQPSTEPGGLAAHATATAAAASAAAAAAQQPQAQAHQQQQQLQQQQQQQQQQPPGASAPAPLQGEALTQQE